MTHFDLGAFVAHADTASMPTHCHGLVYEPWQQDRTDKARGLIAALVPTDQQDAAEAALRAKGIIEDDWIPEEDQCWHGLDANTCPCGCFERDDAEWEQKLYQEAEAELLPELAAEEEQEAEREAQEEREEKEKQEAELAARAAAQEASESETVETQQGHDRRRWILIALGGLAVAAALYILA